MQYTLSPAMLYALSTFVITLDQYPIGALELIMIVIISQRFTHLAMRASLFLFASGRRASRMSESGLCELAAALMPVLTNGRWYGASQAARLYHLVSGYERVCYPLAKPERLSNRDHEAHPIVQAYLSLLTHGATSSVARCKLMCRGNL